MMRACAATTSSRLLRRAASACVVAVSPLTCTLSASTSPGPPPPPELKLSTRPCSWPAGMSGRDALRECAVCGGGLRGPGDALPAPASPLCAAGGADAVAVMTGARDQSGWSSPQSGSNALCPPAAAPSARGAASAEESDANTASNAVLLLVFLCLWPGGGGTGPLLAPPAPSSDTCCSASDTGGWGGGSGLATSMSVPVVGGGLAGGGVMPPALMLPPPGCRAAEMLPPPSDWLTAGMAPPARAGLTGPDRVRLAPLAMGFDLRCSPPDGADAPGRAAAGAGGCAAASGAAAAAGPDTADRTPGGPPAASEADTEGASTAAGGGDDTCPGTAAAAAGGGSAAPKPDTSCCLTASRREMTAAMSGRSAGLVTSSARMRSHSAGVRPAGISYLPNSTSSLLPPWKGSLPKHSTYSSTPSAQMSTLVSMRWRDMRSHISGARYAGVVVRRMTSSSMAISAGVSYTWPRSVHDPKSQMTQRPALFFSTFSALMSRCA
mmetsp:Transcript_21491/g.54706  ORF Transcript_21491/g.54706 Transcript_21491/m.54706 type:complete len:494 (-) Transcript_21491:485-1966(-)